MGSSGDVSILLSELERQTEIISALHSYNQALGERLLAFLMAFCAFLGFGCGLLFVFFVIGAFDD